MMDDRFARFEARREKYKELSDEALKAHFWDLCDQIVAPIVDLARTHTSPSIERSVLLRMGIDSQKAHGVVDRVQQAGLLGKGAGHVLLRLAEKRGSDVREAAEAILVDKDVLVGLFATPPGSQDEEVK
ncbi:MAG: ornithine aminomutase subunit alpha [Brevefilum sp.]|nr:ornithine aminomutase subunit alpha [Brevefilum sp.]